MIEKDEAYVILRILTDYVRTYDKGIRAFNALDHLTKYAMIFYQISNTY